MACDPIPGLGAGPYDQLRNEASDRGIKGRSKMNKSQLLEALSR